MRDLQLSIAMTAATTQIRITLRKVRPNRRRRLRMRDLQFSFAMTAQQHRFELRFEERLH